jgi:hypothetical protein
MQRIPKQLIGSVRKSISSRFLAHCSLVSTARWLGSAISQTGPHLAMSYSKLALVGTVSAFLLFCTPSFAQVGNDTCANAEDLGNPPIGPIAFNTNSATPSGVNPGCGGATAPRDIWYKLTPSAAGDHTFSTCNNAAYDTRLALFDSCGGVAIDCNDDSSGCAGFTSLLKIPNLSPLSDYFLQVGGYQGASGIGSISVTWLPTMGPDIAVSGVGGTTIGPDDFGLFGTSGGIRGYAFATTSCNVGDMEVNWFQGIGNDHPLIAQNLFRVDNGRIEQLGYSFLKHGFCAFDEPGCGACQAGTCDTLGVGCADTYWASLNIGSDGAAKHSVNATTGTYVGNPGPTTDPMAIRGMLQVKTAEMTGSLIAESQYVSAHDHSFGLARNNASWRQASVNGSGDLSSASSVMMFDPAIYAWNALSGATINEVPNMDEGGTDVHGWFFVGYDVTSLGGGLHRYEYAVQNFNSDRSGRAFEIPVQNATILTDVYFRDVDHHSGDPYSNTDWSFSHANNTARWETQTYAQNHNANALRWGTLYNFGFTANVSPQTVSAEIELFKPGSGSVLNTNVDGPNQNTVADCNNNGIEDFHDISSGLSNDSNDNGVPDECEVDCNANGVFDTTDIASGTSDDVNSNGIPDECEHDHSAYGFCIAGPCGNDFPAAGCLTSTGVGASIVATGSGSVTSDDLFLAMSGLPANEFGLFFAAPIQGAGFPFGDGIRVAVGSTTRFPIQNSGGAGSMLFGPVVSYANSNILGSGMITAGSIWNFQGWFRDPHGPCGSSFNLTHGLSVDFTP